MKRKITVFVLIMFIAHTGYCAVAPAPIPDNIASRSVPLEYCTIPQKLWKIMAITGAFTTALGMGVGATIVHIMPACPTPPVPEPGVYDLLIPSCGDYSTVRVFGLCSVYPNFNDPFYKDSIAQTCHAVDINIQEGFGGSKSAEIYFYDKVKGWQSQHYARKAECASFPELLKAISSINSTTPKSSLDKARSILRKKITDLEKKRSGK
jgi:hypothetical protein